MNLTDVVTKPQNIPTSQETEKRRRLCPVKTDRNILPNKANGHLDRTPFYKAPWTFLVDTKNDFVALKRSIVDGDANDHQLGRVNDLAMKIGGLALASYLATRLSGTSKKTMEYVGVASFLSSMVLWPKLFIELPLKFLYGVPIRQKYVDSQGRKKMFFQDSQYVPWDLYSDKELVKLGDRLHIPKNIHNRNDMTKAQAQKIALQGNTLWMLTAGFATPIMTALMCSKFSDSVDSAVIKTKTFKERYSLEDINKIVAEKMKTYSNPELNRILLQYKNKSPEEVRETIVELMQHYNDILSEELIDKELDKVLQRPPDVPRQRILADITKFNCIEQPQSAGAPVVSNDEIKRLFYDYPNIKNFKRAYKKLIRDRGCSLAYYRVALEVFDESRDTVTKPVLTTEAIQKIRTLDRLLKGYSLRMQMLDKLSNTVLLSSGVSEASIRWREGMNNFSRILGIKKEDLEIFTSESDDGAKLISGRFDSLVKSEKRYRDAIDTMTGLVVDFDEMFIPKSKDLKKFASDGLVADLERHYEYTCEQYANKMRANGFDDYAERLMEKDGVQYGTSYMASCVSLDNRVLAIRGGLCRMLSAMDIYKRLADKNGFEDRYNQLVKELTPNNKMSISLEQAREFVLKLALMANDGDHAAKFGLRTREQYALIMKLAFDSPMNSVTEEIIRKTYGNRGLDKLVGYNKDMIHMVGDFVNSNRPFLTVKNVHKTAGEALWDRRLNFDHVKRDLQIGPLFANLFRSRASEMINTNRWFKIFGGSFAALVGVTLFAQLFFGKFNKKEVFVKKDSGVNG